MEPKDRQGAVNKIKCQEGNTIKLASSFRQLVKSIIGSRKCFSDYDITLNQTLLTILGFKRCFDLASFALCLASSTKSVNSSSSFPVSSSRLWADYLNEV